MQRTPKLADCIQTYLAHYAQMKDAKRPATMAKERSALALWTAHMREYPGRT